MKRLILLFLLATSTAHAQPYWWNWERIWPDNARFGRNLFIEGIARAPIRGGSEFITLPDPERIDLLLGDKVRGATCDYSLELVGGRRKWVEIRLGLWGEVFHFAKQISSATNTVTIVLDDLPDGKEIDSLLWMTASIPVPNRVVQVLSPAGRRNSLYIPRQPYAWWDTNMWAVGAVRLRDYE